MNKRSFSIAEVSHIVRSSQVEFAEIFKHGTLAVEFYKPGIRDNQKPHDRDEIYVIATGTGIFFDGTNRQKFNPGDFIFVPAGVEHRFENFNSDFSTWVFFYGPLGGEKDIDS